MVHSDRFEQDLSVETIRIQNYDEKLMKNAEIAMLPKSGNVVSI